MIPPSHLLTIEDLGLERIAQILSLADSFAEVGRRPNPKVPALRGRTVATLFFESSTRTRTSFETAAKRLSADVLSFVPGSSSLEKGESLRDTVETIDAMGIDALIVRHGSAGTAHRIVGWLDSSTSVINAGDGAHQHPTQALIDLWTVRSALTDRGAGTVASGEADHGDRRPGGEGLSCFAGLRVAIVGDIRHSRVARSLVGAYHAVGAHVTLVAPSTLLPPSLEGWPIIGVEHDLDSQLPHAHVVSLLRLQAERGSGEFVPSLHEYTSSFGLTRARAAMLRPDALILHPGPVMRGVELASDVADLPSARMTDQVRNGVFVRMAVLFHLLGQEPEPSLSRDEMASLGAEHA